MINTKTNVRNYTDQELIGIFKSLPSYKYVPKGHHIIFVRSKENQTDVFDDKAYHFIGEKCISVMPCTTNTGRWGLYNFWRYNKKGVAIIKSNEIYYDAFMKSDGVEVRHHRDKVQCLRQIKPLKYYRDGNQNDKAEEIGDIEIANNHTNVHPNSYRFLNGIRTWFIGKSSLGCLVINNLTKYWKMIRTIPYKTPITVSVIQE